MNIINSKYNTQIEVKKSKFLSFLVPIEQFKSLHEKLKKEHPKANHIVWAKRELNEFKQVVENSSDDGEPKGAAGVPTLNVLRGNELINCAILTVRYFGGIKLGVGGMARAYSDAANAVVKIAEILPYVELVSHTIKANYNEQRQIEYNLKELGIKHIEREFLSDRVLYHIKTTQEKIEFLRGLK
jgi:uncharacterized YigZ family protein